MGTCTSTSRHRRKQHKQTIPKNSASFDNKQLLLLPATCLSNQQSQRPQSLLNNFDCSTCSFTQTGLHQTDRNSLIQLYSSNTNNNNNNNHLIATSWMSSSASTSQVAPRIPVSKSRLPVHRPQSSSTGSIKSSSSITTLSVPNQIGLPRPMSTPIRVPLPSSTQPRAGFIPRPVAPAVQQTQASSLAARSRSISPSSTVSAKSSSSSSVSQRLTKTQTIPKPTVTPSSNASKPKIPSARPNKAPSTTTTNRVRPNPPAQPPPIANANAIRDRYKTQTRMNFFTRRTPTTNSLISPSNDTAVIKEESSEQSLTDEPSNDTTSNDLTTESFSRNNLTYTNHHRPHATNTLSSSSLVSDLLNQDALLDDDKCSLKSDDLICDFDDTLTLDSASKIDQTDSSSSTSLCTEAEKKATSKPPVLPFQSVFKEHRSATMHPKSPTTDTANGNLRESLDELTRLSHRMDTHIDGDHNRKLLTRSVSLKPPPASLPPREDAEQISMDIESYRQVMKDVMVVKTVLHQLDRLLKHSDGANMTDSMVGSFHESMIGSRRYSSSGGDGNLRNSVDENSSYDDLMKEIVVLRKEREQDRQTIKLLQEQMYKYSSHPNGQ